MIIKGVKYTLNLWKIHVKYTQSKFYLQNLFQCSTALINYKSKI